MTENLQGSVKCSDIKCGGMATENFTPTEGVGWGPTGPPYSMIVLSRLVSPRVSVISAGSAGCTMQTRSRFGTSPRSSSSPSCSAPRQRCWAETSTASSSPRSRLWPGW
eukprot:3438031-Rhodomonas_salina.2